MAAQGNSARHRARQCGQHARSRSDAGPIDQAVLLANNRAAFQQIDNADPALGRPMFEVGDKDRYNGIVSLEYRPSDDLHVFLDSMYGKAENDFERVDMMWGVARAAGSFRRSCRWTARTARTAAL